MAPATTHHPILSAARAAAVLVVLLVGAQAAGAQSFGAFTDSPEIPSTPAAAHLEELLAAVNSGDPARIDSFVRERFATSFLAEMPAEAHTGALLAVYDGSQGLEFHGVRRYAEATPDTHVVAVCRSRLTDGWIGVVIDVEPTPPHRITSLGFPPARPPSDLPPAPSLSQAEMVKELDAYIDKLAGAEAFSGTVLLAKDGEIIYRKAAGLASRAFNVPNDMETKFNLGSMNKMFTAVAIAQLAERGQLRYDDSTGTYLGTDWLPETITSRVQIRHLLTHSSGLGSYFNETFDCSSRALFRTVDDYKPLVAGETLAFEPGSDWQYSNTGFLLLGAIVEKVSGLSYFEYVKRHIFEPAGMASTDSYEMDIDTPNLAIGYSRERGPGGTVWRNNLYAHVVKGGPAGGGFSTAEDLLRFALAMRSGRLVRPETLDLLWSPKPELHSPGYGYGFMVSQGPDGRAVGHGGGFAGISSELDIHLDSGYTIVVLSNMDRAAQNVTGKVKEMIGRLA